MSPFEERLCFLDLIVMLIFILVLLLFLHRCSRPTSLREKMPFLVRTLVGVQEVIIFP